MKQQLRKLCNPLLKYLESDEPAVNYKPSHRSALFGVSVLFFVLFAVSAWFGKLTGNIGALVPVIAFFAMGFVSLIVSTLGSDSAVCKIWGNR